MYEIIVIFYSKEEQEQYEYIEEIPFQPDERAAELIAQGMLFENGWVPGTIDWEYVLQSSVQN